MQHVMQRPTQRKKHIMKEILSVLSRNMGRIMVTGYGASPGTGTFIKNRKRMGSDF